MKHLPRLVDRVSLHILTEERHASRFRKYSDVTLDVVPSTFEPAKAKHKARALEWFRLSKALSDQDWVLHLDEESVADEHCIRACLDLIERSDADFGQVIFSYSELTRHVAMNYELTPIMRFRVSFFTTCMTSGPIPL